MINVYSISFPSGLYYRVGLTRPEEADTPPLFRIAELLIEKPTNSFLHYRLIVENLQTGEYNTEEYFYSGEFLVICGPHLKMER